MKSVTRLELEEFVGSIPTSEFSSGRDIGRTHGIVCYYASGKHVAT